MKNSLLRFIVSVILVPLHQLSYAQPGNNACTSATNLAAGTSCSTNGTTYTGSVAGEPTACNSSWTQTVWYYFQASATAVDVQMQFTSLNGNGSWCPGNWGMAVYNAGTNSTPATACPTLTNSTMVSGSCVNTNTVGSGDGVMVDYLTGLTIGNYYYIQVGYDNGAGCKVPNFCINRFNASSEKLHNCGTCASPCGSSCGFHTQPSTVAAVTSACTQFTAAPAFEGGTSNSQCWTFTALSTTAGFQEIINSNCGGVGNSGGNVTSFSWTLQSSSCGSVLKSGDLTNLNTFNNYTFTIGQSYTYCVTFTVPTTCAHFSYYPYVWGAVILPVELTYFTAFPKDQLVDLEWSTESELNNNYFSIQHSNSGVDFHEIAQISGAGTSTLPLDYQYTDESPSPGINYYRLVQNDFDGSIHYSQVVKVVMPASSTLLTFSPNPVDDDKGLLSVVATSDQDATLLVFNSVGQIVYSQNVTLKNGENAFEMNMESYSSGIYNLVIITHEGNKGVTFAK